jgi:hypothetical protein
MYTLQLPAGSVADTGELMSVGPPLGSDAAGAALGRGTSVGSNRADGAGANEGPTLPLGDGLLAVTIGTALTSTFMATKTPAMPMPITAKAGATSRPRSKADFLRALILRVCGTQAEAAFPPETANREPPPAESARTAGDEALPD